MRVKCYVGTCVKWCADKCVKLYVGRLKNGVYISM